jgi:hypothetical protein
VRVLDVAEERGVVPVRLHCVAGHDGAGQRERGEQRLEVADLVGVIASGALIIDRVGRTPRPVPPPNDPLA